MPTPTDNSPPLEPPEPPDFSKLGSEYQILTELHRDGDTPTYLARHNGLNRDVTITVVRAAGDRSYLEAFEDDAKLLAEKRNSTMVPVIEGRWLDDHTFAIVRARVRGSTLDQLLSAIGTMPEPRVGSTLRQVAAALGWARANGIKHRRLSPQDIVFQQGSGKVLLAFEPWPNPSDDVATIRNLASKMTGGAPVDTTEYIGLLSGGVVTDELPQRPTPDETIVPIPPVREETVVVQQHRSGMGFNGRLVSAFVALAAVIVLAVVLVHRRSAENVKVTTSNGVLDSGNGEPAGDAALHSNRLDSIAAAAANAPRDVPPVIEPVTPPVMSPPVQPAPMPTQPTPMPAQPPPANTRPMPAPRPVMPADTSANPGTVVSPDGCSSALTADQRRCLTNGIQEGDRALNGVYQRLIAALRKQANVADDDPDPPTVQDLRDSQRRWLEQRDDVCHDVGDGPFYAKDRAACYAGKAADRVKELQARLDGTSGDG